VYTGSRAGILCLVIVLLLNFKFRNVFLYIFGVVILLLLVPRDVMKFLLERFDVISEELDTTETGSRFYIWSTYIRYIASNPGNFFIGASKPLYFGIHQYVPHNYYLTLVYRWGIFPLILVSYFMFRYLVYFFRTQDPRTRRMLLSVFLPLFLISNTVSDVGYFYAFYLCLAFIPMHEIEWDEEDDFSEVLLNET
jgi:O-antigen ligase